MRWNAAAAIQAHDAQIATSGITTVFDCLRMGADEDGGFANGEMRAMADAIEPPPAQRPPALRPLPAPALRGLRRQRAWSISIDFETDPHVRLVSLMDHAPGQRQFQTMDQYTLYYQKKRGLSDEAFAAFVQSRQEQSARNSTPHRLAIAEGLRRARHHRRKP